MVGGLPRLGRGDVETEVKLFKRGPDRVGSSWREAFEKIVRAMRLLIGSG